MKNFIKYILPSAATVLTLGLASCAGDLNVSSIDPNTTTEVSGDALLNKCYANLIHTGQSGSGNDCDVDGIDGGNSSFVRQLFNAQELPSDEAYCRWSDNEGIPEYNTVQFTASHPLIKGLYNRIYVGINYCNQYLKEFGGDDARKTAEARFLRAYYYSVLLDLWGNVPFNTEGVSGDAPSQIKRADLYTWVMSELQAIENDLGTAAGHKEGADGYGRANVYTDWLLQSRLYLNAEVYTGTAQYEKAKEYAKKVIDSGAYSLHTTAIDKSKWTAYQELFMGDNGQSGAGEESLLSLLQDGVRAQSWGGDFMIAAMYDGSELFRPVAENDTISGNNTKNNWNGHRARKNLLEKFFPEDNWPEKATVQEVISKAGDDRALFCTVKYSYNKNTKVITLTGRTFDNDDIYPDDKNIPVCKYNNYYATKGGMGQGSDSAWPDMDIFLFRLAEAYLNYAEADARLNGGTTTADGTAKINALRSRANAETESSYKLDDICDEWSREFYFEFLRRSTLIRFGKYAGSVDYNWAWKGGVADGRNVNARYNLFPLPADDVAANGGLEQNTGY